MSKFRKRPVVIEAVQFNNDASSYVLIDWANNKRRKPDQALVRWENSTLKIPTLEGVMEASPGDWIICGVQGELYPCKPDIFAATYEAVEP